MKNAVGDEERRQDVYDDNNNVLYSRRVPTEQEAYEYCKENAEYTYQYVDFKGENYYE